MDETTEVFLTKTTADINVGDQKNITTNIIQNSPSDHVRKKSEIDHIEKDLLLSVEKISSSLKALNRMAKRPPIDIEFQDLTYTVRNKIGSNAGNSTILKGVSGSFRSGELTAILGPSGAGKSSLMNILVGYTAMGVSGNVLVNGHPREMGLYHKLSCYIMQDDMMQPRLTVQEAMEIAAHLKLGNELGKHEKLLVVEEVISTLGLAVCRDTRTEFLSGGQRKRLAVALELVNNPPIICLDEPTTGLDIVAIQQCISLLKILANHGRTIICTIHQPSASVFSLFDNAYIIAKGRCVYQGPTRNLIPFMSSLGFDCPTTHNPADFILETLQIDSANILKMSNCIQNGKHASFSSHKETIDLIDKRKLSRQLNINEEISVATKIGTEFPTTFWIQFNILLRRMILQRIRNSTSLWIQLAHHLASGFLLGGIFFGIGNNGMLPIANFKYCISVLVFFMYTYVVIPILIYPTELKLLEREYFNRWYGLKAYYAALTMSSLPTIITLGMIFMAITYIMSGQVLEWNRFLLFSFAALLTGLCSEGFGLAVGSMFSATSGSIIGPAIVAPSLALSVYGIGFGPYIETSMIVLMRLSYLRYGVAGLAIALYNERENMDCTLPYCHYSDPQILLRDLGMQNCSFIPEMLGLLAFTIFYRSMAYISLRYRLQNDFSNRIITFVSKILRRK